MSRNSRFETRQKTRRMVMCAILAALSVVVLTIGTLLQVADLTAAAMAGVVILLIALCYGPRYATMTFVVTSVLALVLWPQSFATWAYVLLMGYYPILHNRLARLPRVLGWVVKLLLVTLFSAILLLAVHFLVLGGEGSIYTTFLAIFSLGGISPLVVVGSVALELATFVLYDILLGRLILIYPFRLRPLLERWMKP